MKSHMCAKLLDQVSDLRASQQDIERPVGSSTFTTHEMFHHCLLSRRHFVPLEWLEAVARELHVPRIRRSFCAASNVILHKAVRNRKRVNPSSLVSKVKFAGVARHKIPSVPLCLLLPPRLPLSSQR